jgi:hypothetical protein
MKELVIVSKDRVGLLADISEALGKGKVNINSVTADVVGQNAVVRLVISDAEKGKIALEKSGFRPVSGDTLVVTLEDRPGELSKIARMLSENGVNVTNVYMLGKEAGKGLIAIKVDKMEKARKLLSGYL